MRLAIFSDVHANRQALEAVLARIEARGADVVVCLGDVVGYNADPRPCLDLVRERCDLVVQGNHDRAIAVGEFIEHLPRDGQAAARKHREVLSSEDLAYLESLPLRIDAHDCTFVHAAPERPSSWLRLESFWEVKAQFEHFDEALCFLGHSHLPGVVSNKIGVLSVKRGPRFLVNVGSVGQPRDHDPRACLGWFDTEAWAYSLERVAYDVETAAHRIEGAGLPRRLAQRLRQGV